MAFLSFNENTIAIFLTRIAGMQHTDAIFESIALESMPCGDGGRYTYTCTALYRFYQMYGGRGGELNWLR